MKKRSIAALTIAGLMALQMPITALADVTEPIVDTNQTVTGNVTVGDNYAIRLGTGVTPGQSYTVTVTGNVTNTSDNKAAVYTDLNNGNKVIVSGTVTNNGEAEAINAVCGTTVEAGSAVGNSYCPAVNADHSTVTIQNTVVNNKTGEAIHAENGATVNAGNVEGVGRGIVINDAQVTAGDVTVTGNENTQGVGVFNYNDEGENIVKTGKITATSTVNGRATGLCVGVFNPYGNAEVTTKDISSTGKEGTRAVQLDIWDNADATSKITVYVDGDVTSNEEAVYANVSSGNAILIVNGSVSGDKYAIVSGDCNVLENIKIYAYEVKTSEDGELFGKHVSGYPSGGPGAEYTVEASEDLAKSINYIIKTEGGNLESIDGGILEKFEVAGEKKSVYSATENTKIVVKAASGYEVKAGTLTVTKEADGTYSIIVPRGGGVTIETILAAVQQAEAEEQKASFTGAEGNAVTGGQWNMGPGGYWTYRNNGIFKDTWGYITLENGKTGWFYFDKTGVMLTGWQTINGKEYYFNEAHDGTFGMMLTNTTAPDGRRTGADGVLIQ